MLRSQLCNSLKSNNGKVVCKDFRVENSKFPTELPSSWTFSIALFSGVETHFGNWMFPSSGEEFTPSRVKTPTQLGPLDRANLSQIQFPKRRVSTRKNTERGRGPKTQ
jgi:hypothetical protein